jgi:predicted glycosyltransferase
MRIWIDFINTPQVTFFIPLIEDFRKNDHELILTCRDSGNTVALLKRANLPFEIIGDSVGKGMLQKLFFFPRRLIKLYSYMRSKKPDIAASQSSFYQPVVARLLGVPCLYTNDNEHAKGNLFGFLFASKVILPIALSKEKFKGRWLMNGKLQFYPSVKEAIYLSQNSWPSSGSGRAADKIYFRPEPWSAQYYKGPLNFFDNVLLKLSGEYEVIVLPRDKNQVIHYAQEKFSSLKVAEQPISFNEIISNCALFIGAGGSMTREMAVMQIPVISIYQSSLLAVDRYLIDKGCMIINKDITYEQIKEFLHSPSLSGSDHSILNEGDQSFKIIKNLIYNLKNE